MDKCMPVKTFKFMYDQINFMKTSFKEVFVFFCMRGINLSTE